MSTRCFVKAIRDRFPDVPVLGLFDANPFGVGVFLAYKLPSAGSIDSHLYATDSLFWIGLYNSDLEGMPNEVLQQLTQTGE